MTTYFSTPTAPSRSTMTQTEFDAAAEAWAAWWSENANDEAAAIGLVAANYLIATSATSATIGTGAKSLTVEAGKAFQAGQYVSAHDAAAPTTNYMIGQVTSYDSGTGALAFTVPTGGDYGSGTKTAWTVTVSGSIGPSGETYPSFTGNAGKQLFVNSGETDVEWGASDNFIHLSSNYTLTSTTSTQKLFNSSTNGSLTLATGRYAFKLFFLITSMSATSGNGVIFLKGAGNAVIAKGMALVTAKDAAVTTTPATFDSTFDDVSGGELALNIATGSTATAVYGVVDGEFSVTTAGTIIPSIGLTTAASAVVNAGSSFLCRRLGGTSTTQGSWS